MKVSRRLGCLRGLLGFPRGSSHVPHLGERRIVRLDLVGGKRLA